MCGGYVELPCMVVIVGNAIGYLFFSLNQLCASI